MTDHLVIGASGLVGEHLFRHGGERFRVAGTYHARPVSQLEPLDIRRAGDVQALVSRLKPRVVYLTASFTNVDACEGDPDHSYEINVIGVRNVVDAVNEVKAKLVYFSSDYVFDGKKGPYTEEESPRPVCEYGRQKVFAEHVVATRCPDYLIIRTTVVYGWERAEKNFVCRLLRELGSGQPIRVPDDQIGSPTYVSNLAEVVMQLAALDARGIYHVAGSKRASRYEFACEAARAFGLDASLIEPVKTQDLKQTALRPLEAGMIVSKAEKLAELPLLDYSKGLRAMASERVH